MFERLGNRLGLNAIPQIFVTAAAIAIVFVAFAIPFHEPFAYAFGLVGSFTFQYFGWFYVASVSGLLIFLIWIAFSKYGGIRLGADEETPQYSTETWFAMLFAAGIGTILMFWGVAEPLSHFANPPMAGIEPQTVDAAKHAMNVALYHFGLHTWTIFTLPALAIAYFSYRKNLPMRISSVFYPVLGDRIFGPIGWTIDIIALLGTLFGVAVSVGLGTLQLNSGLNVVFGVPIGVMSQIVIVAVITIIATVSVALGLDRGIKRLSEINIVLALIVMLFVWLAGPTLFITSGIVQNFGNYMQNLPWMAFWTEAYQGTSWQQSWTVFYWAWTISWAPYVGIFIARISRGRTIRQFVLGALLAPMAFTLVWFSVFGLAAIDQELNQGIDLVTQVENNVAIALFDFLATFPLPTLMSGISLIVIVVFLTTSADSAALVVDQLSRNDIQPSLVRQRIFWTFLLGAIAGTLMLGGGLDALQNVITTLGFPFCVLLVFMAYSLRRSLHQDLTERLEQAQRSGPQ
ncbi:BCCT family transporter [Pseudohongiella sp. SYSU M77423]|uniref:BCCT family transporter n=1 Tax=Pseudohongiella sp. SYSU M77423 TaxID=3042312 RepID=UPI000C3A8FE0|nr:BCCT family transporter [Pseudohongiella sp. SYSU M77423]MAY57117.1 multidrug DMT transporter permease [Gammaproteobacteria bacterium]MBJ54981.1 multidrug DMT transporter permease [Gammaproteobacteria bacterium]MDH7942482.1 BCCT family transporter [Pseudohongiella sp. SYSU M77423]HBN15119.1 multidrug DMT transporter permease [Pseudohongiella sp.]